jgi:uncharacterized protein (TIGR02246 family)
MFFSRTSVLTVTVGVFLTVSFVQSRQAQANPQDEKAIHQAAEAYVEAFNNGDAKAVAGHFTQDGDYIDETGRHLKGRDAISANFEKFFAANKGLSLQIVITSIRFPAENLAIEDGTTVVSPEDDSPSQTARYTAVRVKQGDGWKISSVREATAVPPSHQEHLEQLSWLIGEWTDQGEHGDVLQSSCAWSMNGNFIVRSFTSSLNGNHLGSGVQWIGWDPKGKQVHSWSFDSSGGFGHGRWTGKDGTWVIESTSVLPSGETVTQTDTVTHVDADTLTMQSTKRKVDDQPVPDSEKIEIKRVN